jgi:ankyrin repeat protein
VNSQDGASCTPLHDYLHRALYKGKLDVARLLIEHGADVDFLEDDKGRTALQVALEKGYHDFAKWLSDHGPK